MSSFFDLVKEAADAEKSGNLDSYANSNASSVGPDGKPFLTEDQILTASSYPDDEGEELAIESQEEESISVEDSPQEPEEGVAEQDVGDGGTEDIFITDHKGRRKITIDYNDRDKIKKAHQLAAGMRLFQKERDEERQLNNELRNELQLYKTLDSIWEERGVDGVVEKLSGKTLDDIFAERQEKKMRLETADPADRVSMEYEERLSARDEQIRELAEKLSKFEEESKSRLQQSEEMQARSVIDPAFSKYAFSDKDGDERDVNFANEMMWDRASKAFDQYEQQGIPITKAVVEREFRQLRASLNRIVKSTAEKTATKKVAQQKKQAQKAAANFVESKTSSSNLNKNDIEELGRGNFLKVFQRLNKK